MATLKMSDISRWDATKIDAKVAELRRDIFNMNMQKQAAGVEKPHLNQEMKKNIARLLTVKNQKNSEK